MTTGTGSLVFYRKAYISQNGEVYVLISYQRKGLLKADRELVPNAQHKMCARHIYAN